MSDHPFGLREEPFAAGHERRFLHPSPEREEIVASLTRGLRSGESFVLLTGEAGTGKSSIVHEAFGSRKFRGSVAILTNPFLTRSELLEEICIRFGLTLPETPSKPQLMALLERHLIAIRGQAQGQPGVLVVDEAHLLDIDLLEELRLLANLQAKSRKLLQVALVGLPLLEETLALPRLEPLRQRLAVQCRVLAFSAERTRAYLHHRLGVAGAKPDCLPESTCRALHQAAHGIAREINTLATEALAQAQADGAAEVTPEHVDAAVAARGARVRSAVTASPRAPDPPAETRAAKPAERPPAPAPVVEAKATPRPAPPAARPAEATKGATPSRPAGKAGHEAAATKPPAARAEKPVPPVPTRPGAAPAPAERPARDPEVRDWVSRFKGEGPIQIGSRSGPALRPLDDFEEGLADADLMSESRGSDRGEPETRAAKRPKGGMTTVPRSGRSRRRGGQWTDPTRLSMAAGLVLLVSIALILIPRSRDSEPRLDRSARSTALRSEEPDGDAAPARDTPAQDKAAGRRSTSDRTTSDRSASTRAISERSRLSRMTRDPGRRSRTSMSPRQNTTPDSGIRAAQDPVFAPAIPVESEAVSDAPPRRYALEVATYINESRAREEMDRLAVLTALPTRLRLATDYSGTTYRILVGRFDRRTQAERAAEDLVGRGILNEARITSIGPAPPR